MDALAEVCGAHDALRPPNRMPVSQGAAQNLFIKRPGGAAGYWNPSETSYMVEPIDMLASRTHRAVVFVGPSQSGKTVAFGEGWLAHAVVNDPGDMLIVQMTQDKAREYSKQRVERAIRHSPTLWALRGPSSKDATIHDRQFRHGMWLKIAWPTVTNLSSTSYRYVFITDYDRIPDDIDGEGDAFTLGGKRTTTFMSRGKIAIESSPGRPLLDPHWRPATPHEAPPVRGILGIYNGSDRRRWQWQCPQCREWFEPKPGIGLFGLPSTEELLTDIRGIDIDAMARQYARAKCPHGNHTVGPEYKDRMNLAGRWVPDGQHLDLAGQLHGEARQSDIAGYWLGGAAATYIGWETLISKHLQALLAFSMTADELPWQTTVNTDQGAPYMSRALAEAKDAKSPAERKDQALQRFIVPAWARFLMASVDVQGGIGARFVVQVHAVGPDREQVPIDRYDIRDSLRGEEGEPRLPIDPSAFPEDWDVLNERVMRSTYKVEGSDLELKVHHTVVDTGGEGRKRGRGQAAKVHEGVTANAYAWRRRLRREGLQRSVTLVKGVGGKNLDWIVRETEVGGRAGHGDVPLFLLNSNRIKDIVAASGKRESGPGALRFPGWLSQAWVDEFTAEIRNEDGTWTQIRARNEAFDLCCYVQAGCVVLKVDTWRDWDNVPSWAAPLDQANSGLVTREARQEMQGNVRVATTPLPARAPLQRRVTRPGYLG